MGKSHLFLDHLVERLQQTLQAGGVRLKNPQGFDDGLDGRNELGPRRPTDPIPTWRSGRQGISGQTFEPGIGPVQLAGLPPSAIEND